MALVVIALAFLGLAYKTQHPDKLPQRPLPRIIRDLEAEMSRPPDAAKSAPESEEIRRLREQRAYAMRIITAANAAIASRSFRARAETYCRFMADGFASLATPDIGAEYRRLLADQPATREGELWRQQRLSDIADAAIAREKNARECMSLALMGAQRIPDDEEFRSRIDEAQKAIARIDQQIAAAR
jgi:hypothetical protein